MDQSPVEQLFSTAVSESHKTPHKQFHFRFQSSVSPRVKAPWEMGG